MPVVRLFAVAALTAFVPAASAQSLLYRPPNLSGTWVPAAGVLQFNFLHRFIVAPAPTHKVANYPTFTFALGLGHGLSIGTLYATNSTLILGNSRPNEFELFGRLRLGAAEGANGVSVAVKPAYNTAAQSVDGELAVDLTRGPFTVSVAGRGMARARGVASAKGGAAGGLLFRLNDYVALDGDVAKMLGTGLDPAWSAGVSMVIPGSPHTFSLHASNATSTTIQGASIGVGTVTYGFEFTIPIHFSRFAPWFGRRTKTTGERAVPIDVPFMNAAAQVTVREYRFAADSVTITAGQAVSWINHDQVAHTVTFESGDVPSSADIAPHATFAATFARPGVYRYHCVPHPMMKGVVVVK
jgi:plastocyanin